MTGPEPLADDVASVISDVWEEVLEVPDVDPRSDFFDLGGHSLLGARICRLIEQRVGVPVKLRDLFIAPTVEELTLLVVERGGRVTAPPEQHPGPAATSAGVSGMQADMLEFVTGAGRRADLMMIRWTYHLHGQVEPEALALAFDDVLTRHAVLRYEFRPRAGGGFDAVTGDILSRPLTVIDARGADAQQRRRLEDRRSQPLVSWEPDAPPHLRATLTILTDEDALLVCEVTHLVFDGVSRGVIDRDLGDAYTARLRGESALGPVDHSFARFAASQADASVADALPYWRRTLDEMPSCNTGAAPHEEGLGAVSAGLSLSREETAAVAEYAAACGTGVSVVYLTAWMLVLGELVGNDDIAVAVPVSLRDDPFAETVGPLVNQLLVRAAPGRLPPAARVTEVRDAFLRAWNERAVHHTTALRALGSDFRYRFRMGFRAAPATDTLLLPKIDLTELPVPQDTTLRRDLALELAATGSGTTGVLLLREDAVPTLSHAATPDGLTADVVVAGFHQHLRTLLDQKPSR